MHYSPFPFFARTLPLLALGLLAAAVYWLVQTNESNTATQSGSRPQHTVDYLVDDFSASILTPQGTTHYRLHGNKLAHYQDDQSYEVTEPKLRAFLPNQPPLTVHADFGTMSGDGEKIELFGNAELLRDARPASPNTAATAPLSARSAFFRVLPNKDILETDQAIELRNGNSVINAIGATYNNVIRSLHLHQNVIGHIMPLQPSLPSVLPAAKP